MTKILLNFHLIKLPKIIKISIILALISTIIYYIFFHVELNFLATLKFENFEVIITRNKRILVTFFLCSFSFYFFLIILIKHFYFLKIKK